MLESACVLMRLSYARDMWLYRAHFNVKKKKKNEKEKKKEKKDVCVNLHISDHAYHHHITRELLILTGHII